MHEIAGNIECQVSKSNKLFKGLCLQTSHEGMCPMTLLGSAPDASSPPLICSFESVSQL